LKEVKRFSTGGVLAYGEITTRESHVAELPLSCVREHAKLIATITVAVLLSTFTCEEEDGTDFAGSRDATLAVPTEAVVNLSLPIVDPPKREPGRFQVIASILRSGESDNTEP